MRLKFESWYMNNNVKGDNLDLFREGVLCYRIGAYRASFIMTYLGLQASIKDRLLKADKKPENIPENKWIEIKSKIQDDKIWDQSVYDAVMMKNPDSIFLINDDIRKQYEYWRNIRNDCAHAKDNIIDYPHVESFWLFIQSNYNKFIVNGGKSGLLDKLKRHYDTSYTEPDKDISYIIENITNSMKDCDIPVFLDEAKNYFEEEFNSYNVFLKREAYSSFWGDIVKSEEVKLREALSEFVKKDKEIFINFIEAYPEQFYLYIMDAEFIRVFWNDWIWRLFRNNKGVAWQCVGTLIKNEIIPNLEKESFIKKLIDKNVEFPPENINDILEQEGYFERLKKKLFNKDSYGFPYGISLINQNWSKIRHFITKIKIDKEIVNVLNSVYLSCEYGTFYNGLSDLLETNDTLRESYMKILTEENAKIPSKFEKYISVTEAE